MGINPRVVGPPIWIGALDKYQMLTFFWRSYRTKALHDWHGIVFIAVDAPQNEDGMASRSRLPSLEVAALTSCAIYNAPPVLP